MKNIKELKELLDVPKKVVITSHVRPDADALGSSLAFAIYLEKKGHSVSVIMPTDYPDFLKWMPTNERVLVYEKKESECGLVLNQAEIICSLDYNALSRIGVMGVVVSKTMAKKILIDHHLYPDDFADFQFTDTNAAATALLVYQLINLFEDNELIDSNIAECIYAGMVTDTGSFRFPSTNQSIHLCVADLMDKGLDHSRVHRLIYDINTEAKLKFLGYCLMNKLKVFEEYNTAYISLSIEDISEFNLQSGDTEGLVNYSLSISGIVFAVLFKEDNDHVKISFRSKGKFSVNDFARKHFNGGGHMNASGGRKGAALCDVLSNFENLLPIYKSSLVETLKELEE